MLKILPFIQICLIFKFDYLLNKNTFMEMNIKSYSRNRPEKKFS